jgi:hypothetical protein
LLQILDLSDEGRVEERGVFERALQVLVCVVRAIEAKRGKSGVEECDSLQLGIALRGAVERALRFSERLALEAGGAVVEPTCPEVRCELGDAEKRLLRVGGAALPELGEAEDDVALDRVWLSFDDFRSERFRSLVVFVS